MENIDSTIEKIKKLLALSESPNVNEAANASRLARALMLKYDIDMEQVSDKPKSEIISEKFIQQRPINYKVMIYNAVAKYCFCRVLVNKLDYFSVVGKKHHILVFREMVKYVMDSLDKDVSVSTKSGKIQSWGNASYRDGWAQGFKELIESMSAVNDVDERGLIIREDAEVMMWMNENVKSSRDVSVRSVYMNAYSHGIDDGKKVSMNTQVQ